MSKDRENIPRANMLMGSMRSMGYSFESAVADVIDNSISANCKNVILYFPLRSYDALAVGILDDGRGMSSDELFEAMRYGSDYRILVNSEIDAEIEKLKKEIDEL